MTRADSLLVEELCELQIASGWSDGVVTELAAISRCVEFPAGAIIFSQEVENRDLFLLSAGRVGLDMYIPARGAMRILTLCRGELLAWSALIGGGRMTATATALEPVRAIAIDGGRLLDLCDRRHDIGYPVMQRVAWALSHRLVATRLQLLDLFAQTTPHLLQLPAGGR